MNIYFAAPLFAESEQLYNEMLVGKLREKFPEVTIYLPQEQGDINDKSQYADSKKIALADTNALLASDLLIAVLDGPVIDVGVASEIGVAYQAGIPMVGLYTDSRQQGSNNPEKLTALSEVAESQFPYANLYTIGLIKLNGQVVSSQETLLAACEDFLK
ncbi:nucleoside 2-deoxyribosyltransferase [Enterococcus timonensis]|uniref:nucleoside 2-deoxyribosyltransferase n=1 Tax=Enterococcus timonensis TaxID=1852364 RepID=UPI0008DA0111|nr:nucleoside 2-deoxyribosyltransferase [Enterococcus timonensis]